LGLLL